MKTDSRLPFKFMLVTAMNPTNFIGVSCMNL